MNYSNIKQKLFHIGIILMFMLPIFPSGLRPIIIGIFVLLCVINFSKVNFEFDSKRLMINSSIYLFITLSVLYSENMGYALNKLETMSSLIVFPLAFSIVSYNTTREIYVFRKYYMFIYIVTIVVINLIFFLYHFEHYKSTLITHYVTVIKQAQGGYNIHPIYLSMHICMAIIFSFFLFKWEQGKIRLILLFLLDIILIGFLFILLKKGPILGLGIVFTLFVIFQNKKKLWLFYLGVFLFSLTIIITIPKLKKKFSELSNIESIEDGSFTSTNIRYSIYNYALETIMKSPIIGHGIGDFKDVLVETYKDSPLLYTNRFNTHNQYLSFTTSIGLLGLSLFFMILIYNLTFALKFNNQELILILIFYCLVMGFENILEREDGVIYFSFFMGLFSLFSKKEFINKKT